MDLKTQIAERLEVAPEQVDAIIKRICDTFLDFDEKEALGYLSEIVDIHEPEPEEEL